MREQVQVQVQVQVQAVKMRSRVGVEGRRDGGNSGVQIAVTELISCAPTGPGPYSTLSTYSRLGERTAGYLLARRGQGGIQAGLPGSSLGGRVRAAQLLWRAEHEYYVARTVHCVRRTPYATAQTLEA